MAETDFDFDPNALIAVPGMTPVPGMPVDPNAFTDMVEQQDPSIAQELNSGNFGMLEVQDFSAFKDSAQTVSDGEYVFAIEQKYLREATAVTRMTAAMAKGGFGQVRITIFPDQVKFATFNQSAFSEILAPAQVAGVEKGKEVAFVFDLGVLTKIAATFDEPYIKFTYEARPHILRVEAAESNVRAPSNTKLELATTPPLDFTNYHSRIGAPKYVAQIDPALLRRGLDFAGMFVKKDDNQPNLSLVHVRNNTICGGAYAAITIFQTEALGGIELKVKYETLGVLSSALPRFATENTHLFETESFFILRDPHLFLGIERTEHNFPTTDRFIQAEPDEYIQIPRSKLQSALGRLSVVSGDRDLLVSIKVDGRSSDVVVELETKDVSGKPSSDRITGGMRAANEGKQSEFLSLSLNVSIVSFARVVAHFEAASNVRFSVLGDKALIIYDEDPGSFSALSVLSLLTPAQVQQMKTLREEGRAKKAA